MFVSHVGWVECTVVFCGGNGVIYEESNRGSGMYMTGQPFGPGCTVGCGIDYGSGSGECYFTLDGELVGNYYYHSTQKFSTLSGAWMLQTDGGVRTRRIMGERHAGQQKTVPGYQPCW